MRVPTSKPINLTDNFYDELLGVPPQSPNPMPLPSQAGAPSPSTSQLSVGKQHLPSPIKTQFSKSQSTRPAQIPRSPISAIDREYDIPEEEAVLGRAPQIAPNRTHTPGHLASKSTDKSKASVGNGQDTSARSRSQSHSQGMKSPDVRSRAGSTASSAAGNRGDESMSSSRELRGGNTPKLASSSSTVTLSTIANKPSERPMPIRSSSAIASKPSSTSINTQASSTGATATPAPPSTSTRSSKPEPSSRSATAPQHKPTKTSRYTAFPPPPACPPSPSLDVPAAPASGMYWSLAPCSGAPHPALRAHTATLISSTIFIFGGCDANTCFNTLFTYDCDSYHWSAPMCTGTPPPPLRAMTCTAVGKRLVVFGGGDGPVYCDDVWVLDTVNYRWSKPAVVGVGEGPSKRRAHTACLWRNGVYIFGGGDGVRALNDVWRLDVSELASNKVSWKLISPSGGAKDDIAPAVPSKTSKTRGGNPAPGLHLKPKPRGYHTANIVGSKLIVFGGSDGDSCFSDIWLFDITTNLWSAVSTPALPPLTPPSKDGAKAAELAKENKTSGAPRLSHTSTLVGSYLFIIGGHDGVSYSSSVLCLNLVTMTWDRRKVYGHTPAGRGYHGAVLCDGRIFCIGGFDGVEVFPDVWVLELGGCSYYSQISCFSIEV